MNRKFSSPPSRSRQRGITLIIGLILLAMLMVISLIGFRNTTMSERMTGNALDRNTSFQSAESAGKEALTPIESGSLSGVGYYEASHVQTKAGGSLFWTSTATPPTIGTPATDCFSAATLTAEVFNWTKCATEVGTKYTNNATKALYVIELISSQVTCATPVQTTITTYRVTSKSTGGSGNAEVVLQTIYPKPLIGTC